jgi:hypothetical protein
VRDHAIQVARVDQKHHDLGDPEALQQISPLWACCCDSAFNNKRLDLI